MATKTSKGIRQFIKYALLGFFASATELITYAILSFWVFASLKDVDFKWWILDYSVARGGLGTLYAIIISYIAGQTVNFFVQRKKTFKANNNPALSAVMFAVMVVAIWLLQIFLIGILTEWLSPTLGMNWSSIVSKAMTMTLSLIISFPLNKFVIMRRTDGQS